MIDRCFFCKGRVEQRSVQHVHQWGEKVFIFKNVPAEVCSQCGEIYFAPQELEKMDKVVQGSLEPEGVTPVPVYTFP